MPECSLKTRCREISERFIFYETRTAVGTLFTLGTSVRLRAYDFVEYFSSTRAIIVITYTYLSNVSEGARNSKNQSRKQILIIKILNGILLFVIFTIPVKFALLEDLSSIFRNKTKEI